MSTRHKPMPYVVRWRRAFARALHGTGDTRSGLSIYAVAVGFVLSEYADYDTGAGIRPGLDRIATTLGISHTTAKRSVSQLVHAGWLTQEQRGAFGRASIYRLTIPPLVHIGTGEVHVPHPGLRNGVSTDPVRPRCNGVSPDPMSARSRTRNGVSTAHVTGPPQTPHQYRPDARTTQEAA